MAMGNRGKEMNRKLTHPSDLSPDIFLEMKTLSLGYLVSDLLLVFFAADCFLIF